MGSPEAASDSRRPRRGLGVVESFTRRRRQRGSPPHFTSVDGPVFALVNLPEVVKGALFARYSRSPKSLRRLFLDEFVETGAAGAGGAAAAERRHRPGGAPLRARLRRVRRRLGGPAGRRPPRVRGRLQRPHQAPRVGPPHGLPRAVDPLRPLRRPARRTLALSRAGGGRADRRSSPSSRRRSTTCSRPTPGGSSRCRSTSAGVTRASRETPTSSTATRSGRRRSTRSAGSSRPRRGRTWASTARARRTRRSSSACARRRSPRPARARTSC